MADDRSNPVKSLIGEIQKAEDFDLTRSLRMYLKEGIFGEIPIYTKLERHRFISELFRQSDSGLQERMRSAFSNVLESFEPANPKDDAEYLFYLVSLGSVIRSSQTKERLRRWVRQGTFDTWQHEIFNLYEELILAVSSYDADDEWIDFLLYTLPKRAGFKRSALGVFRALWLTRGATCLSLVPDVLLTSSLEDEAFVKSIGYLLRLIADKIGFDQFSQTLTTVLTNIQKSVDETWVTILFLDYLVEQELSILENELETLVNLLRERWKQTILKWQGLPEDRKYEAFEKLLDASSDHWHTVLITSPKAAFVFRGKFILEIADEDHYIRERSDPLFEALSYEEEPVYRVAAMGASNG